jgi:hypothetical protein
LFLGSIIQYLEEYFQIPSNLPMIYETTITSNDDDDDPNRCILSWDSPLSPSSVCTRMEVEVVGIYTGSGTSKGVPNMAMVVVKKAPVGNGPASKIPPMMKNLFDDSERRILQSLDRGLDDLVSGKIQMDIEKSLGSSSISRNLNADDDEHDEDDGTKKRREKSIQNVKTAEEAIEAELMMMDDGDKDKDDESTNRLTDRINRKHHQQQQRSDDGILDAQVTSKTFSSTSSSSSSSSKMRDGEENHVDAAAAAAAAARARAMATMNTPADSVKTTSAKKASSNKGRDDSQEDEDFAVTAARRIAAQKQNQADGSREEINKNTHDEDYAVAAARKIAAANGVKNRSTTKAIKSPKGRTSSKSTKSKFASVASTQGRKIEEGAPLEMPKDFRAYESMSQYRNVHQSISHPQDYLERRHKKSADKVPSRRENLSISATATSTALLRPTASIQEKARKTKQRIKSKIAKVSESTNATISGNNSNIASTLTSGQSPLKKSNTNSKATATNDRSDGSRKKQSEQKQRLNINVVDEEVDIDSALNPLDEKMQALHSVEDLASHANTLPSRAKAEMDALRETNNIMRELANQDMNPEELLQDILKFDEDKKREEAPGSGFVSGAFDKAKELLQERQKKREGRTQQQSKHQLGVRELEKSNFPKPRIDGPAEETTQAYHEAELTPEEELKAMFAAGQRIANGMITQSLDDDTAKTLSENKRTSEKDLEELIAAETSVSNYARVLDDELAELEVSINSSPGEDLDGPAANPMFDIMSGPEKYNPNVDLDAVNYPGAMPGTKEVRLPKELQEAVRQAEFAASVLMNLETVEDDTRADGPTTKYFAGKQELSSDQVENLQKVLSEACEVGIIDDPLELMSESSRLQMILDELWNQPQERFREIASNYKDLLLSEYFVKLVKQRMKKMAERDLEALRNDDDSLKESHAKERDILGQLVLYAQVLLKEARALGAELEAQQLEIIRSICKVAMDPSHKTEEETALALSDAVRDMRPLLDDIFVAYLKYAVAEEEAKLARAGLLDDPEHSQWLFVLKIVQQGVYAEIAKGINRYIEHIWYILRMKTSRQRRLLLEALVDDMPTMDVRPFVQVVENIVGSLGDSAKGEFDGVMPLGEMTNKLLQLHRDVKEILPPERIAEKSRDADEWAARQKKRMLEQREIGEQRLHAAKQNEHLEDEIDLLLGSGEMERFD